MCAHLLLQQVHTLDLLRHILRLHRDPKEVQNRLLGGGVAGVAVCKHLACLVAMPQQSIPQRHPAVKSTDNISSMRARWLNDGKKGNEAVGRGRGMFDAKGGLTYLLPTPQQCL